MKKKEISMPMGAFQLLLAAHQIENHHTVKSHLLHRLFMLVSVSVTAKDEISVEQQQQSGSIRLICLIK